MLYTDEESRQETVTVPSFKDYTAAEANSVAGQYNLNASFTGAISSGGKCVDQDIKEGTAVPPGTVVKLTFSASSNGGFND